MKNRISVPVSPQIVAQRYIPEVPIETLRHHPANPRRGDDGFVSESIKTNGFYGTVLVQESTNCLIAGHTRVRAASLAGLKTVPVILIDCSDEQALQIMLMDNRAADRADYDNATLASILKTMQSQATCGLAGTGFSVEELDELWANLETPMKLDPGPKQPKEKPEARPTYELVFEDEEQLADWREMLRLLKKHYDVFDSVEKRLLEHLKGTLSI